MHKLIFFVILLIPMQAFALDFIPGLKGFGTDTRGPFEPVADPEICIVTSTGISDGSPSSSTRNGVSVKIGTLQQCVEYVPASSAGKIVIFETSGTIKETGTGTTDQFYDVTSNTFIAGQTAPSPGITLANFGLRFSDVNDVIVQHLRIRYGNERDWNDDLSAVRVAADGSKTNQDLIFDHLSLSWSNDGEFGIYTEGDSASNDRITISHCIVSEGIDEDSDGTKGISGGPCWVGTDSYTNGMTNYSVHNNLMATMYYRAPIVEGSSVVFVNNLAYGISGQAFNIVGHQTKVNQQHTLVANAIVGGEHSGSYGDEYILNFGTLGCDGWKQPLSGHKIYLLGNSVEPYGGSVSTQSSSSDWSLVEQSRPSADPSCDTYDFRATGTNPSSDAPDWPTGLTYRAASEVEAYVSTYAGARPTDRDSVDTCIVADVAAKTGTQLAGDPSLAGSCAATTGSDQPWPELAENSSTWTLPSDPFDDDDSDGYTNIEEWLHAMADTLEGTTSTTPSGNSSFSSFAGSL